MVSGSETAGSDQRFRSCCCRGVIRQSRGVCGGGCCSAGDRPRRLRVRGDPNMASFVVIEGRFAATVAGEGATGVRPPRRRLARNFPQCPNPPLWRFSAVRYWGLAGLAVGATPRKNPDTSRQGRFRKVPPLFFRLARLRRFDPPSGDFTEQVIDRQRRPNNHPPYGDRPEQI
jgi:hypothetical protein